MVTITSKYGGWILLKVYSYVVSLLEREALKRVGTLVMGSVNKTTVQSGEKIIIPLK